LGAVYLLTFAWFLNSHGHPGFCPGSGEPATRGGFDIQQYTYRTMATLHGVKFTKLIGTTTISSLFS
jgi:hypothetical protein